MNASTKAACDVPLPGIGPSLAAVVTAAVDEPSLQRVAVLRSKTTAKAARLAASIRRHVAVLRSEATA